MMQLALRFASLRVVMATIPDFLGTDGRACDVLFAAEIRPNLLAIPAAIATCV